MAPKLETGSQRTAEFDFVKGALVLLMVIYHWMNYFAEPTVDLYRYLRFLTPSFTFITGFLVTQTQLARPNVDHSKLSRRLFARGAKLFGLFAVLNLAVMGIKGHGELGVFAPDQWVPVLLAGQGYQDGVKTISFFVLMPIAYLLILLSLLVPAARKFRPVFVTAFAACLSGIALLAGLEKQSPNLEQLSMGFLGAVVGSTSIRRIVPENSARWALVFYAVYLAAITVWNVIYPLQLAGVCLTLALLYLGARRAGQEYPLSRLTILLGRYSLAGYILQIAVLQILQRGLRFEFGAPEILRGFAFPLALLLTVAGILALDKARLSAKRIDRLYSAVFA